MSAAEISSLSAIGSRRMPSRVTLLKRPGEIAVEEVGDRGDQEDREADVLAAVEFREKDDDEDRDEEDAKKRQRVRQVHDLAADILGIAGRPPGNGAAPVAGIAANLDSIERLAAQNIRFGGESESVAVELRSRPLTLTQVPLRIARRVRKWRNW